MEKLKKNLSYFLCLGLGIFTFVFFAIPYLSSFASLGIGDATSGDSKGINGYKIMDLWDGGFGGVISSLFQIFVLAIAIVMLVYGVFGLLKVLGVAEILPEKLGKVETEKYGFFALIGYSGLNVLLLVFLIIFCSTNTESVGGLGATIKAGFKLNAGIFITLSISIAAFVLYLLLNKKSKKIE